MALIFKSAFACSYFNDRYLMDGAESSTEESEEDSEEEDSGKRRSSSNKQVSRDHCISDVCNPYRGHPYKSCKTFDFIF